MELCSRAEEIGVLNCVDLEDPDISRSVSLVKQACLDSGFFHVINHGISEELMEEVFVQSRKFFALNMEEKMELLRNKKNRGYTPPLDEKLDATNQADGDYKEGFYIGIEFSEDDSQSEKPFYGPNLWPSEDLLHGWRGTMEQFHQEALRVARMVARLLALALDLEAHYFDKPEILGQPIAVLRLLHYEGRVSDPAKGIFGAGAHTDFGLITLLATDDVPGLQICEDKDSQPQVWRFVKPIKGGFLVNLGDMLERWTNGIFRSTLHRVLMGAEERYSVAFFVEPSHECVVECLPSCCSDANPPKFPPVTCERYLTQRYQETHKEVPGL
ncbi:2-oxoglutarate (2OG) and Fe(II)-dependent oxygenase superfamily protein [Wolffia australiana]